MVALILHFVAGIKKLGRVFSLSGRNPKIALNCEKTFLMTLIIILYSETLKLLFGISFLITKTTAFAFCVSSYLCCNKITKFSEVSLEKIFTGYFPHFLIY